MTALVFIGILACALMGVPLFVVMALFALASFTVAGVGTSSIAVEIYRLSSSSTLMTIPLFTFAGYLMAESDAPKRLLRFAEALIGWIPGGIAIVGLAVCAFFTAFTGASGVTIIALGGLLYPILKNEGYKDKFSIGLITTSGSLGLLFPPSLPIILYGVVAKVDINHLFKAGIVPGILIIVLLSIWSVKNGNKSDRKRIHFSFNEMIASFKNAFFEVMLPFGVLVGIYGGIVTPSEAAAFTAFYVLIVECFIYRDIKIAKLPKILVESTSLVGTILLILCCALAVTSYIVDEEIPTMLFEYIRTVITNKYAFLACLNVFLLIVGSLMDIFSAIIVVVPLIAPIATEFGVDPVHLAIIFLTNLEIGYITPPVGINLFISSIRFDKTIIELYKSSLPFLLILLLALIIITYVPFISLMWI